MRLCSFCRSNIARASAAITKSFQDLVIFEIQQIGRDREITIDSIVDQINWFSGGTASTIAEGLSNLSAATKPDMVASVPKKKKKKLRKKKKKRKPATGQEEQPAIPPAAVRHDGSSRSRYDELRLAPPSMFSNAQMTAEEAATVGHTNVSNSFLPLHDTIGTREPGMSSWPGPRRGQDPPNCHRIAARRSGKSEGRPQSDDERSLTLSGSDTGSWESVTSQDTRLFSDSRMSDTSYSFDESHSDTYSNTYSETLSGDESSRSASHSESSEYSEKYDRSDEVSASSQHTSSAKCSSSGTGEWEDEADDNDRTALYTDTRGSETSNGSEKRLRHKFGGFVVDDHDDDGAGMNTVPHQRQYAGHAAGLEPAPRTISNGEFDSDDDFDLAPLPPHRDDGDREGTIWDDQSHGNPGAAPSHEPSFFLIGRRD